MDRIESFGFVDPKYILKNGCGLPFKIEGQKAYYRQKINEFITGGTSTYSIPWTSNVIVFNNLEYEIKFTFFGGEVISSKQKR